MGKYLSVALMCLFLLSACEMNMCVNKAYFVSTYDRFIADFEKNHDNYSSADWASKEEKMRSFVNDCYASYKEDMSVEERVSFWTKYVEFMIVRHTGDALQIIETEDTKSEVEIYKEIKTALGEADFEKLFKQILGDDIEKAVDDVLDELNKWGDRLKDWLDTKN